MSRKQYVSLQAEQCNRLEELVRIGRVHARTINHAHMLLLSDESEAGPGWSDERIADVGSGLIFLRLGNIRAPLIRMQCFLQN